MCDGQVVMQCRELMELQDPKPGWDITDQL